MATAKITRCKHFFHGVCLRKWLYVQDRCPLCHEIMMYQEQKINNKEINESENDSPNFETPVQSVNDRIFYFNFSNIEITLKNI